MLYTHHLFQSLFVPFLPPPTREELTEVTVFFFFTPPPPARELGEILAFLFEVGVLSLVKFISEIIFPRDDGDRVFDVATEVFP